jgi:uncharacterized SAM-binding protein YcdF (DUF218 family)
MSDYVQPLYTVLLLLAFAGLIRCWRQDKTRKPILLTAALLGLFLISWPPFVSLLLLPFELPFPPQFDRSSDAEAIVVLSGGVLWSPGVPHNRVANDTLLRCQYAASLHNHWRPLPLLMTGGGSQPDPETPPYALLMRDVLIKEGVQDSLIWTETKSRTTHENAEYSAQVLRQKGITKIVLVTDAYHMRRAAMSFRKQGFIVVPAACGHRILGQIDLANLTPGWESISYTEDLLHETVGLVWYKIHGWI